MSIETRKYVRKPFQVEAVRITKENLAQVCEWCGGTMQTRGDGQPSFKVSVKRPLNEKQTFAKVGDWILYAVDGYKVYTDKAFREYFTPVNPTLPAPKKDDELPFNVIDHTAPKPGPFKPTIVE